jgi:pantothenate kinase
MQFLSYEEALGRIGAFASRNERTILGIVGPPGCGKSTIAQTLQQLNPIDSQIVPMDGVHLANTALARLGRSGRKGAPDTFDVHGYIALLGRLRDTSNNDVVYAPEFRRDLDEPIAGAIEIQPTTRLLIAEGNYLALKQLGWQGVAPMLNEVWYLDVDPELRINRLIARHVQFGRSESDAKKWVQETDEPNARLIEGTKSSVDFVVKAG